MSVQGINPRCWIITLFIRDDGERLLLGDGYYQFKDSQLHFAPNTLQNTVVDVQGGDGSILVGQVRRGAKQSFDGYIGDASTSKVTVEEYRLKFLAFFAPRHKYEVIYIDSTGSAMKRQKGFLVDAPSVEELYQIHPAYHVALAFEDVNYYAYDEDEDGNEIYSQSANVLLSNAISGGFPYDQTGLIWDDIGAICNDGIGGSTSINVKSVQAIYPVWVVNGLADNPVLENLTTGQKISYTGRVSPGQTLVIDMLNRTALLQGTNVLTNVQGEWLQLQPGINQLSYITENENTTSSVIKWQEVIE